MKRCWLLVLLAAAFVALAVSPVAAQLSATIEGIDPTLFPLIVTELTVTNNGQNIGNLVAQDFTVREDGVAVPFSFTPPQQGGGVRAADVVFLIDNSGSMQDKIDAVKNNARQFADQLVALGVDYRLGAVKFGQGSGPNPFVYNNGNLTDDVDTFKGWIEGMYASGGTEPGLLAILMACQQFNFRPGSQRHFIIITDEDSDGSTTVAEACACAQPKNITVHAAVDCGFGSSYAHYCGPASIRGCTGGLLFGVTADLGPVLMEIAQGIAGTYLLTYSSPDPVMNGQPRQIDIEVRHQGQTAHGLSSYTPGGSPRIELTQETLDLEAQPWAEGSLLTIRATITDAIPPGVSEARLFTRRVGTSTWTTTSMSHQGNNWYAAIPTTNVLQPGVQYYLWATDGSATTTEPPADPSLNPRNIAVLPNVAPVITHQPVPSAIAGRPVTINVHVFDQTNQVSSATVYYRRALSVLYTALTLSPMGGGVYSGQIPGATNDQDIAYYLEAVDDLGVKSSHGSWWWPHWIIVPRDGDGDAIPDLWETTGDLNGDGIVELPLHDPASPYHANPLAPDVYVEIDYMAAGQGEPPEGHRPNAEAVSDVITSFAAAGVRLHIDDGRGAWVGNTGSDQIPHDDALGSSNNGNYVWTEFTGLRNNHFAQTSALGWRRNLFHYCIFAHQLGGLGCISGIARDIPSQDFIVSLGGTRQGGTNCWAGGTGDRKQHAGTLMHELGHTLGLRHGGPDHTHYKPNYLSVMNYHFQMSWLPRTDGTYRLDFSRFDGSALPGLNEGALNEATGLGGSVTTIGFRSRRYCPGDDPDVDPAKDIASTQSAVNWNCQGQANQNPVQADINGDGGNGSTLQTHNDWDHIDYGGGSIGDDFGAPPPPEPEETVADELDSEEFLAQGAMSPTALQIVPEVGELRLSWSPAGNDSSFVYRQVDDADSVLIAATSDSVWTDQVGGGPYELRYWLRGRDRYGRYSMAAEGGAAQTLAFLGYQNPIENDGSSVFARGVMVPVRFLLRRSSGEFVLDSQAELYLRHLLSGTPPGNPFPAPIVGGGPPVFQYDDVVNAYVLDLDTGPLAPGRYSLETWINDGTRRTVEIEVH